MLSISRQVLSASSANLRPRYASSTPDYLVIGAGSAGCVISSRLAQAGQSVTLLEAGSSDRSSLTDLFVHMPTALAWPMSMKRYNWGFKPEPEPALNNRVISCPRGKGLGGSSSINGMVYVRGHPSDFDNWEKLGAQGWNYNNVLPYFRRAEHWQGGENLPYRGVDGPLHVKFGDNAANTPLFEAFIKAGDEAGYGTIDDYNASRQEGFGKMAMTVFHSGKNKGMRCSVASAYLHPTLAEHGDSLSVVTDAYTQRILFDGSRNCDPPRAIGVEYFEAKSGDTKQIMVNKEVIVCTGSIQTPQLLQVSGIGDQEHLKSIGVDIVCDNPNVGQNLQDHLELYFQQEVKPPISIAPVMSSPLKQLMLGLEWIFSRTGLGATNHFESCAFVRSSSKKTYPDIQFHFLPVGLSYDGVTLAHSKTGHSMQIHIGTCRSKSRGFVRALTKDMKDAPRIKFNYMSREEDWDDMRNAIEIARQVMRQPSMEGIAGDEIMPGKDTDVNEYIRDHAESAYHPCGTARMGRSQEDGAVVDNQGRVFGVSNLRVADASIFPSITNGNLNAPVIMVAERISDLVLGRKPLAAATFDVCSEPWRPTTTANSDRERTPICP